MSKTEKNGKNVKKNFRKEMVFCYQKCSSDQEKLLKFEAEGREFAKILRSLEQYTVKSRVLTRVTN